MATSQRMTALESNQHKYWIPAVVCLALAVLTIAAFWQLKDCGFINLDDDMYVYANAHVQSGLNANSIKQAFSSELAKVGHWHPLTWLSLMLDYQIFGLNPFGYHLVNLLFHVVNTLLLFLILRRMTKSLWPSAFVAALFAIHPLHVESVAWITERKDVLSTFFWMLTLGAYSYYVEHRGFRRYVFVLLFFTLGLLSKPMLVTLPFVLLLLDYWPLQRFSEVKPNQKVQPQVLKSQTSNQSKKKSRKKQAIAAREAETKKPAGPEYSWSRIFPLLWEKLPFFVLAIISSIVTYLAAHNVGAVSSIEEIPLGVRIGNAFVSYIVYIIKMIWPSNLAIFYPHPPKGLIVWQVVGSLFLFIAVTLAVIWRAKKLPYLAAGWFLYLITLVPVIGIIQAGAQSMADRYTYIPMIGLFIMVVWGIAELSQKWKYRKEIIALSSALVLLVLSILTWKQVGYWQSSITLYDHTLKVTENNGLIHNSRGVAYGDLGNYRQAIEDLSRAIEIKPHYAEAYNNRCNAYNYTGNHKLALEDCSKAIGLKTGYTEAYNNRGVAHSGLGNYSQAMEDYNRVIEIEPGFPDAYYNRGKDYAVLGNHRQAIEDYSRAIKIKPNYAIAFNNKGNAYTDLGNHRQAVEDYTRAIEIQPDYSEAYFNRGNAFVMLGSYREAIDDYARAIEIQQDFAAAYKNRGIAYARFGNNNLAIQDLKTAAKLGDESAKAFLRSRGIN